MSELLEKTTPEREQEAQEALFTPEPKKIRAPLTSRLWAKTGAFVLCILMICTCFLSVLAAACMISEEVYTTPKAAYLERAMQTIAENDGYAVATILVLNQQASEDADNYLICRNVAEAELRVGNEEPRWTYRSGDMEPSRQFVYESIFQYWTGQDGCQYLTRYVGAWEVEAKDMVDCTVTIRLDEDFVEQDSYRFTKTVVDAMYYFRYSVYVIMAVSAILAIACFVFLLCAAGRHPEREGVGPGWDTRIPFDLLTAGISLGCLGCAALMSEAAFSDYLTMIVVWAVGSLVVLALLLWWCMSFALRLKLGRWWKNTLCFWCCKLAWDICRWCLRVCWAVCRWCGRTVRGFWRGICELIAGIPLVWKVLVIFAAFSLLELFIVVVCAWDPGVAIFWLGFVHLLLFPVVIAVALMLRKLERGGKALAEGELTYQVDTRKMLPILRRHGENLNSIAVGMNRAVEERTKSERMKTELITNVSHDIKTPLTSIINYSDLIGREECDNPKITEYAEVLHRQSERLKRLIDDLVEASKASTGNLDVRMEPCEVGVLLTQAAGEYEQRLCENGLTLVTRQSEKPLKIMADGRRLWRVFDNLMNNVCKYALPGTRVYLTLEKENAQAVISLKNTSREELDLTPDELLERFVRGDTARRSEGSGLGLSIARSLTELQRGKLELTVDGDLFKVVLRFPLIP